MDILKTKINYIVLVHNDEIPFVKLASGKNMENFSKAFNFQKAEVTQDGNTGNVIKLIFRYGIFQKSDENRIAIIRLEIEERKLIVEMEGSSNDARDFYNNLVSQFVELVDAPSESFLEPIVVANESEIIARLQFPISGILSSNYLEFVQSRVAESASSEFAEAIVSPSVIVFLVDFQVKDTYLSQHRIVLSKKEYSVQPAIGYPVDEQIYFSKAPVDTQTHIMLLNELEKTLAN